MQVDVGDNEPIKMRPYRTLIKNREVIDKAIDEMLEADVIRRSRSPSSFPVVIVDKKDCSKRFCVAFRRLNKITKKNSYSLPLINDILALTQLWLITMLPSLIARRWVGRQTL